MTEKEVLEIFKREKALLSGHFLLSSGLHSGQYMQCALVLQKPWIAEKLCRALAAKIKKARLKIDAVVGPALGGVLVSYELARALKVKSLFAERIDGSFALRRGFELKKNDRVAVVEDVVTTGKSTREVLDLLNQMSARCVLIASIVDRSEEQHGFAEPFYSLLKMSIRTYKQEDCPLCKAGKLPLVKPGSRVPVSAKV
jgi:orotate phosphoribosyltransferase